MPDLSTWALLALVTVATSTVSGVLGLAGGMLLLSALLLVFDPVVAIPLHGAVQLVSNGSRAWFQRSNVRWDAVARFVWPLLPAGALGLALLRSIPAGAGRIAIGGFVLLATWVPDRLRLAAPPPSPPDHPLSPLDHPASSPRAEAGPLRAARDSRRALPWGGALVGFLSTTVGATGPLLAPFVLALGLPPAGTVGTLAACQVFQHLSKLVLFGATGFDLTRFAAPAAALGAAAVAGSALGTRLLDRLPAHRFRAAVRWVLTAVALGVAWQGVRGIAAG